MLVARAQLIKDLFHALFPTVLLFFIWHSWLIAVINLLSVGLKTYVYNYVKEEEPSDIAIIGVLMQIILTAGYINAI